MPRPGMKPPWRGWSLEEKGERWQRRSFSKTLLMDDSRVIPLKLEGLVRSRLRPLGMGMMRPCWKIVGIWPEERMALNRVESNEERITSAKSGVHSRGGQNQLPCCEVETG